MLTKKLACPCCHVSLRIADSLPPGKKLKCPKCSAVFRVPGDRERAPSAKAAVARPRKPVPLPEEDEDLDEEPEERPAPRKRRKKRKQAAGNPALVWSLVLGGAVLLIGVAASGAVIYSRSAKKAEPVAANTSPKPERSAPVAPAEPRTSAPPPTAGGESSQASSGRGVFDANNCARCHMIASGGEATVGGGGRGRRGPDLSHVGADPSHTTDWLMAHIRNPKSHKPESTMPRFEGKISEPELRSLAEYLASLK